MNGDVFKLTEYTLLLAICGGGDLVYVFFVCHAMFSTLFGHLVNPLDI